MLCESLSIEMLFRIFFECSDEVETADGLKSSSKSLGLNTANVIRASFWVRAIELDAGSNCSNE